MDALQRLRAWYAEELQLVANLQSEALVAAFAAVPRERFLDGGPWQIWTTVSPRDPFQPQAGYRTTPDANPAHVYHNVAIALDAGRRLNTGQPATVAAWLDWLAVEPGMTVYHVGTGSGYYTAILAHLVGPHGRIVGVEVDPPLARRAQAALAEYRQVTVVERSAAGFDPGAVDAIFVSAGLTHPPAAWVDHLRAGGRMLLPLTFSLEGSAIGGGGVLAIQRHATQTEARFLPGPVLFYSAADLRTAEANRRLGHAFARGRTETVRSFRRSDHAEDDTCWLHLPDGCLSTRVGEA
ncbi:MAG: methyltransferase domain-containing protein [Acidobacteriota bacterium]|nr:methyltransferase domain-containing protein [Acidobacteriota bacterium]